MNPWPGSTPVLRLQRWIQVQGTLLFSDYFSWNLFLSQFPVDEPMTQTADHRSPLSQDPCYFGGWEVGDVRGVPTTDCWPKITPLSRPLLLWRMGCWGHKRGSNQGLLTEDHPSLKITVTLAGGGGGGWDRRGSPVSCAVPTPGPCGVHDRGVDAKDDLGQQAPGRLGHHLGCAALEKKEKKGNSSLSEHTKQSHGKKTSHRDYSLTTCSPNQMPTIIKIWKYCSYFR